MLLSSIYNIIHEHTELVDFICHKVFCQRNENYLHCITRSICKQI